MCVLACIPTWPCVPLPLLGTILLQTALQLLLNKRVVICQLSCRTYAHYCSATYNLQHNFPSMPASQLQSADEECAICKESMKVSVTVEAAVVASLLFITLPADATKSPQAI